MREIIIFLLFSPPLLAFPQILIAQSASPPPAIRQKDVVAPSAQDPPPAKAPQDDNEGDVVHIDTTLVTVPVAVMDRDGRFIPNLHREDFRIWEDGVEQQIASFEPVETPFTVVLLLDTSGSTHFRLQDIQEAAVTFIDQLRPDDRVFAATFDSQMRVLNTAGGDRDGLRQAIRQTRTHEWTRLYDAVDFVMKRLLARIPGRKALVLFTDGDDSASFRATYKGTIRHAEESDVLIYAVQYDPMEFYRRLLETSKNSKLGGVTSIKGGAGGNVDYTKLVERANDYLNTLVRVTGGRLYRADDPQTLARSFSLVAGELGRQYSISYYPKQPAQAGQRRQIRVRTRQEGLVIKARSGYLKK